MLPSHLAPMPTSQPIPCAISPATCFLPGRVYLPCHLLCKTIFDSVLTSGSIPLLLHHPSVPHARCCMPVGSAVPHLCIFLIAVPPPHTCLLSPLHEDLLWRSLHPLDRTPSSLCLRGSAHLSCRVHCIVMSHCLLLLADMFSSAFLVSGKMTWPRPGAE